MGKIIDEYIDIKLQQKCVSKTIDALWKMAQKYQKIQEIVVNNENDGMIGRLVREIIADGNDEFDDSMSDWQGEDRWNQTS